MNMKQVVLTRLDADNDSHWTKSGEPRLDVLKDMLGAPVSRENLTMAIPGLTRDSVDAMRLSFLSETKGRELIERQRELAGGQDFIPPSTLASDLADEVMRESDEISDRERALLATVTELRAERSKVKMAQQVLKGKLLSIETELGRAEAELADRARMSHAQMVKEFSRISRETNPSRLLSRALSVATSGGRARVGNPRPLKS